MLLIDHDAVLESFQLDQYEFIDLCILCGCDYTGSIGNMGPSTAYKYLVQYKNIEGVLHRILSENRRPWRKKAYIIPENFEF